MATDHMRKSGMMLQMQTHKTENHHTNCLRQMGNEKKTEWGKTVLYNAANAVQQPHASHLAKSTNSEASTSGSHTAITNCTIEACCSDRLQAAK